MANNNQTLVFGKDVGFSLERGVTQGQNLKLDIKEIPKNVTVPYSYFWEMRRIPTGNPTDYNQGLLIKAGSGRLPALTTTETILDIFLDENPGFKIGQKFSFVFKINTPTTEFIVGNEVQFLIENSVDNPTPDYSDTFKQSVTVGDANSSADYKILNDGTDHTVWQAALDYAFTNNKNIFLLDVEVQIENGSVIHPSNIGVKGSGNQSIFKIHPSRAYRIDNSEGRDYVDFEDVRFDSSLQILNGERALNIYDTTKIRFTRVTANFGVFGFYIFTTTSTANTGYIIFDDCDILGANTGQNQDLIGGGALHTGDKPPYEIIITNSRISQDVTGIKYYKSLQANNLNHPVTDGAWWQETTYATLNFYAITETYGLNALTADKYQGAVNISACNGLRISNSTIKGITTGSLEKVPADNFEFTNCTFEPAIGGKISKIGISAVKGHDYDTATEVGSNFSVNNCTFKNTYISPYKYIPDSGSSDTSNVFIKNISLTDNRFYFSDDLVFYQDNIPAAIFVEKVNGGIISGNQIMGSAVNKLLIGITIRNCKNINYGGNLIYNAIQGAITPGSTVGMVNTNPNIFINVG